jgi:predicted DNA-binding antitoxin AbrB/MazE fold protein
MTFHTDAIYEGGVLRPLVPLSLKENEVVALTISTAAGDAAASAEGAQQRNVLADYVRKVESRSEEVPADGLSNRDHDRLIYGK